MLDARGSSLHTLSGAGRGDSGTSLLHSEMCNAGLRSQHEDGACNFPQIKDAFVASGWSQLYAHFRQVRKISRRMIRGSTPEILGRELLLKHLLQFKRELDISSADGYEINAIHDTPVGYFFNDLRRHNPAAVVIHMYRNASQWPERRFHSGHGAHDVICREDLWKFLRNPFDVIECLEVAVAYNYTKFGLGVLVPTIDVHNRSATSLSHAYEMYSGYIQAFVPPERLFEIDVFECRGKTSGNVVPFKPDVSMPGKCSSSDLLANVLTFLRNMSATVSSRTGVVKVPPLSPSISHQVFTQCKNDVLSSRSMIRNLPILYDGQWRSTGKSLNKTCFRKNGQHPCSIPRIQMIYQPLVNVNFGIIEQYLLSNEIRLYMVGDSVMEQQMDALKCEFFRLWERSSFFFSPFLGSPVATLMRNPSFFSQSSYEDSNTSLHWYDRIPRGTTHVVINSGHWWTRDKTPLVKLKKVRFVNATETDILKGFESTMRRLALQIRELSARGMIVYWRDTNPGGGCSADSLTAKTLYSDDYAMIPEMNEIARRVVTENGGRALPIYKLSALMWHEHFDAVHYCMENSHNSVPSVWNKLMLLEFWRHADTTVGRSERAGMSGRTYST